MEYYTSNTGETKALDDWRKEADRFYKRSERDTPKDWLERWTKVLGLRKATR